MKKRKKEKWHKSKGTNNTSINHDSVMLSDKGDPDFEGDAGGNFEGDADGDNSDDDIDLFEESDTKNKSQNWTMHKNGRPGRSANPVLFLSKFNRGGAKGNV